MMKVSEFLEKNDIPEFLLGAFFGRYECNKVNDNIKTFFTYSEYLIKETMVDDDNSRKIFINNFVTELNRICRPYSYWVDESKTTRRAKIVFELENDLNLNEKNFHNRLKKKIYNLDFLYESPLSAKKQMFIRGFFELRGTVDKSSTFFAMDYKSHNKDEVKRARLLIDYLDVPIEYINLNFRELQLDFRKGNKRETQIRINIYWYATNIGLINDYKIKLLMEYKNKFITVNKKNGVTFFVYPKQIDSKPSTFENRLTSYYEKIYGKELTEEDLKDLRRKTGITSMSTKISRDISIVNYVREYTDDKCTCCCNDYDIKDRSFKTPYGKYYFEIHHMVSIGQNKELDDIDNLVKLCPTCHACLKKGRGDQDVQREYIKKIFDNNNEVLNFCKSYFDEENLEVLINNVWLSLK